MKLAADDNDDVCVLTEKIAFVNFYALRPTVYLQARAEVVQAVVVTNTVRLQTTLWLHAAVMRARFLVWTVKHVIIFDVTLDLCVSVLNVSVSFLCIKCNVTTEVALGAC